MKSLLILTSILCGQQFDTWDGEKNCEWKMDKCIKEKVDGMRSNQNRDWHVSRAFLKCAKKQGLKSWESMED